MKMTQILFSVSFVFDLQPFVFLFVTFLVSQTLHLNTVINMTFAFFVLFAVDFELVFCGGLPRFILCFGY